MPTNAHAINKMIRTEKNSNLPSGTWKTVEDRMHSLREKLFGTIFNLNSTTNWYKWTYRPRLNPYVSKEYYLPKVSVMRKLRQTIS